WHQRVSRADPAAFQRAASADGRPGLKLFDEDASLVSKDDAAIFVRFIEPEDINARVIGLNVLSSAGARQTALVASNAREPVASAGFPLYQVGGTSLGVVIYQAIHWPEEDSDSGHLRGLVVAVLRLD